MPQSTGLPATLDVEIMSVATAVPDHKVSQSETHERALREYPHLAHLHKLFGNTGIDNRYLCEPIEWYHDPHGWEERTEKYRKHALDLLEDAASRAVADAGLALDDIDIIVVNTITGLAIPSLDAMLMNRLAFRRDVERLPIFGLGCGGGVAGLTRTAQLARARPDARALFLTVDLCSLCMRPNDKSPAMFVSAALFGDGAAAVVLHNRARSGAVNGAEDVNGSAAHPRVAAVGEHCWPQTEHIMGWDVKSDGFGVVLSPKLPALMRRSLRPAVDTFLERNGLSLEDFSGFLFHPGGRKVLETTQDVLELEPHDLRHSWAVLRDYGNLSSATAIFVMDQAIRSGARGLHLLAAFGPGFSAYFVAVNL
jgi:alkylresorcinol/alkylpyrone synthase